MLRALYSAATGMEALQINIDNIAHNIANVNTTGFKQRRTQFQDLVAPGSKRFVLDRNPHGSADWTRYSCSFQRDHFHSGRLCVNG